MATTLPEVWLRGPIQGVTPLLQPVAHCLLQAREELSEMMKAFPEALLWEKPAGVASAGFHLQHLKGVLDRLFTYANDRSLTDEQLLYLKSEGTSAGSLRLLIDAFNRQVEDAIQQLKLTPSDVLTETRLVGRAKLPSTVLGLYFHAAEHTMRHLGQLLVTVKILKARETVQ
jgi:uncharacterized damage-inducible protein DinB